MAELTRLAEGDTIEHHLLPGFRMTVLAVEDCEVDANRSAPHAKYKIVDPEDAEDWLCAYDVRQVFHA